MDTMLPDQALQTVFDAINTRSANRDVGVSDNGNRWVWPCNDWSHGQISTVEPCLASAYAGDSNLVDSCLQNSILW